MFIEHNSCLKEQILIQKKLKKVVLVSFSNRVNAEQDLVNVTAMRGLPNNPLSLIIYPLLAEKLGVEFFPFLAPDSNKGNQVGNTLNHAYETYERLLGLKPNTDGEILQRARKLLAASIKAMLEGGYKEKLNKFFEKTDSKNLEKNFEFELDDDSKYSLIQLCCAACKQKYGAFAAVFVDDDPPRTCESASGEHFNTTLLANTINGLMEKQEEVKASSIQICRYDGGVFQMIYGYDDVLSDVEALTMKEKFKEMVSGFFGNLTNGKRRQKLPADNPEKETGKKQPSWPRIKKTRMKEMEEMEAHLGFGKGSQGQG